MEGPAAAETADNEYMTMDADKWSEHDDTYKNRLDCGGNEDAKGCESSPDSRAQNKEEKVATTRPLGNNQHPNTARPPIHPLPDRYMTIRRPPMNALLHGRPGMKQPPQLGKLHAQIQMI